MNTDTLCSVVAEHLGEASFLWLQRASAVHAPNYAPRQFADLDERLVAHLDSFHVAGNTGRRVGKAIFQGSTAPTKCAR